MDSFHVRSEMAKEMHFVKRGSGIVVEDEEAIAAAFGVVARSGPLG